MDAIREMYARWAAGDMGEDDQWGDLTAEPRGLDSPDPWIVIGAVAFSFSYATK